jgi:hypothetical protein
MGWGLAGRSFWACFMSAMAVRKERSNLRARCLKT